MKRALAGASLLAAMTLALGLAAPAPARDKDLGQAMKEMATDIKAKHQAAGRPADQPPSQALGSSKTVNFSLPMKNGQGRDSVNQYCLGYTLKCVAVVKGPDNTYSGQVSTSQGTRVSFADQKSGQTLNMTLPTSFWGDTTFSLFMRALDQPLPDRAEVELTCDY